ncbi:glycosyltransferase family 2 protein [Salinimicrobium flavum]|uniref:Glycosyltransferase family 2 protein n=1 Tax=Salinimicrobium flavum TaxID=1737065 RepID=A0ABW5IY93_9FLAO
MILLVHSNGEILEQALIGEEKLEFGSSSYISVLWKVALEFPEELICWVEKSFLEDINFQKLDEIFHHDLIMASYPINSIYFSDEIGYIDQLPFININREVQYGTWQMSSDVGGIKGEVILKFREIFGHIDDLGFLLNSIAKLGQQNGLFCYSEPLLIKDCCHSDRPVEVRSKASKRDLFSFVYSHYKIVRLWLLFWCFVKYEKSFPGGSLITAFFKKKFFKKDVDLSDICVKSEKLNKHGESIDVIIPTLGRRDYLLTVLEDLKSQTLLPQKVIVVEQNPDPNSQTDIPEIEKQPWPFKLVHHFTHQTGACNARNVALEEVNADWVFFADDDNRMEEDILQKSIQEIKKYGLDLLTLNYRQKGESLVFDKLKQWGTFGAGNSIVAGKFASKLRFDIAFEYGYAEDKDYGMQLRNSGCDIIYHPALQILHLKAPRGGFREITAAPWVEDKPKPSPTLMIYLKKYYTQEQLKGFKAELFFRYYFSQQIKNPVTYLKTMRKRWLISEKWAEKILKKTLATVPKTSV